MIPCIGCGEPLTLDALDDGYCSLCSVELDEDAIQALTIAKAVALALPRAAPAERRPDAAPIAPGMLYGLREAGKLLRLDRSGTLRRAIDAGHIRTIKIGGAERISGAEILRIHREGLPKLDNARRLPAPTTKRQRHRAPKSYGAVGSIAKIPL